MIARIIDKQSKECVTISEGCGTDAPGSYISWLRGVAKIHVMKMQGKRFNIGNLES